MSFPFSDLPADATVSAADQCLEHVIPLRESPEHTLLQPVVQRVRTNFDTATQSLAKKRAGELTATIKKEFTELQDTYSIFVDGLSLTARRTNCKAQSEAAETVLKEVHEPGRNLRSLARPKQLGIIEGVVKNCSETGLLEAIQTAGADYDFNELKRELQETKAALNESAQLEAIKSTQLSPTQAKYLLANSLSDLYNFTAILADSGHEEYQKVQALINETLEKFRPMLRKKSQESSEE